jgi:hypothetical protein
MRPFFKVMGAFFAAGTLALSAGHPVNAQESAANNVATTAAPDLGLDSSSCVAGGGAVANGTTAQAKHSAEATAHKTVKDPNNQLGTSLQGRTRGPVNCVTSASADTPSENAIE